MREETKFSGSIKQDDYMLMFTIEICRNLSKTEFTSTTGTPISLSSRLQSSLCCLVT
jgi:hypothetical protein